IRAEGLVETEDRARVVRGLTEVVPTRVFLRETDKTVASEALRELGSKIRNSGTMIDGLHTLMHTVRDEVEYEVVPSRIRSIEFICFLNESGGLWIDDIAVAYR
ncbi:MAG TPA: hypothetical protein PLE25_09190, partial [Spirochaetales bacterium]|nr:hypothetical protein [Spirochaetales bacterium]